MASKSKNNNSSSASLFQGVIDRGTLRQLAGSRYFERGEDYFDLDLVDALTENGNSITAEVSGTHDYCIEIWLEGKCIDHVCSCPLGLKGEFCKHLVAAGLAWIDEHGTPKNTPRSAPRKTQTTTQDDIKEYLSKQKKSVLVTIIMAQLAKDEHFHNQLLMDVASKQSGALDIRAFCSAFDNAVYIENFIEYFDMWDYTERIDRVVEAIRDLMNKGHAVEVIEITEHALARVETAIHEVDDSGGHMGLILDNLQELHLKACVAAKPDPKALARRLFEWELSSNWDTFYDAAKTYSRVLGKTGRAEYLLRAETEWETVPQLKPNKEGYSRFDHRRSEITRIMRSLASRQKNVEALVAIESRDLSCSFKFLEVAQIYKKEKSYTKAIEWAERGVDAFVEKTDFRLREFLADEYHRAKRHDDAMIQIWACFEKSPSLEWVKKLNTHAKKYQKWEQWREKTLNWIRSDITKKKRDEKKNPWGGWRKVDHSLLVEVFLWEKDEEAAWREARDNGCSNELWMKLATKREKEHPADAVAIYKKQIEPIIARKNKAAYSEATTLLKRISRLMNNNGEEEAFTVYLADLRACHKPKRNFMKSLDRSKLK